MKLMTGDFSTTTQSGYAHQANLKSTYNNFNKINGKTNSKITMHRTILGKEGSPTHSNESKSPSYRSITKTNFKDGNQSGS